MKSEIEKLPIGELMEGSRISFENTLKLAKKIKNWEAYIINKIGKSRKVFNINKMLEYYHDCENEKYLRNYIKEKVIEFRGRLENIKISLEDEHGTNLDVNDKPYLIGETGKKYTISASYKGINLSYYSGLFADEDKYMTNSQKSIIRYIYLSVRNNFIKNKLAI